MSETKTELRMRALWSESGEVLPVTNKELIHLVTDYDGEVGFDEDGMSFFRGVNWNNDNEVS